jgi:hypothetical protein
MQSVGYDVIVSGVTPQTGKAPTNSQLSPVSVEMAILRIRAASRDRTQTYIPLPVSYQAWVECEKRRLEREKRKGSPNCLSLTITSRFKWTINGNTLMESTVPGSGERKGTS